MHAMRYVVLFFCNNWLWTYVVLFTWSLRVRFAFPSVFWWTRKVSIIKVQISIGYVQFQECFVNLVQFTAIILPLVWSMLISQCSSFLRCQLWQSTQRPCSVQFTILTFRHVKNELNQKLEKFGFSCWTGVTLLIT